MRRTGVAGMLPIFSWNLPTIPWLLDAPPLTPLAALPLALLVPEPMLPTSAPSPSSSMRREESSVAPTALPPERDAVAGCDERRWERSLCVARDCGVARNCSQNWSSAASVAHELDPVAAPPSKPAPLAGPVANSSTARGARWPLRWTSTLCGVHGTATPPRARLGGPWVDPMPSLSDPRRTPSPWAEGSLLPLGRGGGSSPKSS